MSFILQTLLQGRCLRFAGKRPHLNTPDRAILLNASWYAKLLAQTLLILFGPGLIAHCAYLNHIAATGRCWSSNWRRLVEKTLIAAVAARCVSAERISRSIDGSISRS